MIPCIIMIKKKPAMNLHQKITFFHFYNTQAYSKIYNHFMYTQIIIKNLYSIKNKYEAIIKKIHEPIVIVQSMKNDY